MYKKFLIKYNKEGVIKDLIVYGVNTIERYNNLKKINEEVAAKEAVILYDNVLSVKVIKRGEMETVFVNVNSVISIDEVPLIQNLAVISMGGKEKFLFCKDQAPSIGFIKMFYEDCDPEGALSRPVYVSSRHIEFFHVLMEANNVK